MYIIFVFVLSISVLGLFGNAMVFWAVKKHRDLRTKHGVLLSFLCLYQSLVLLLELFSSSRNLIGKITHRSACFYSLLPLSIAANIQLTLIFVISLDIIFLVVRPTKYNIIQVFPYVYLVQAPCIVSAAVFLIMGVISVDNERIEVDFAMKSGQQFGVLRLYQNVTP
ncbi:hypothetical protein RB195_015102 [Necator americanus]|uniref:G-protein coupled receptors family 1 profile domain-containing protein n=1 Tax=Necator americanus TaxID=51031 RepID=A0ABR1E314_NECAM